MQPRSASLSSQLSDGILKWLKGGEMMQGEGVGGHPHYGHHMPMDLHVPQHFPYYAGWVQSEWKERVNSTKTKGDLFPGRISSHGPSLHEHSDAKYLMFLMWPD